MSVSTRHDVIRNFIGGEWVPARSGRTTANVNPATGESLGDVVVSGREEAEAAIAAAKAALPGWRRTPPPKRGAILQKAADLFAARTEELAMALCLEEGKTLGEARGEITRAINVTSFMAGEGRRFTGASVPSELPSTTCWTRREPVGVVGIVTPWNFPVAIPVWKLAPALVAGCTVVFKPASITPWCARIIAEIFTEAGLPRGVLNVVFGPGSQVGDVIVNSPDIAAISFTGSNEVGGRLYTDASKTLKKVQAEMGGKNPVIILEDADLELAAAGTVQGAFGSTGQRCTATSRAVVVEAVAERFIAKVVEKAKALKVGRGDDATTQMGPVVDEGQLRTVLEYLEIGKKEATLACGGARLTEGEFAKGLFVEPTVFTGVTREMKLAQDEIFGPVLSILVAKDFEDAMAIANDTRYGLSSSIYTNDMSKVFRYADESEAGILHVNSPTVGGEAHLPFGGVKATGLGGREMGSLAIDFYTEWKTVYVDYTGAVRTSNFY